MHSESQCFQSRLCTSSVSCSSLKNPTFGRKILVYFVAVRQKTIWHKITARRGGGAN